MEEGFQKETSAFQKGKVPTLKLYKHVSSTLTKLHKINKVSLLKKIVFYFKTKFIPRLFKVLSLKKCFDFVIMTFNKKIMKCIPQLNHLNYQLPPRKQSHKNTTLIFNFRKLQPKLLVSEPAQKQPSIFSFFPFRKTERSMKHFKTEVYFSKAAPYIHRCTEGLSFALQLKDNF